jgi:hypothetical protein
MIGVQAKAVESTPDGDCVSFVAACGCVECVGSCCMDMGGSRGYWLESLLKFEWVAMDEMARAGWRSTAVLPLVAG